MKPLLPLVVALFLTIAFAPVSVRNSGRIKVY